MHIENKEKVNIFVKNYYKSLSIKLLLTSLIPYFMYLYLTEGIKEISSILIIAIIITPFIYFLQPDHLRKETEKSIQNFQKRVSMNDDKLIYICNLRKFNGPTFGTLHINEKEIKFIPFRDNLQDESFLIRKEEIKSIDISFSKIKSSIFFEALNKAIIISYDNKKVILQVPEPEKTFEKICA